MKYLFRPSTLTKACVWSLLLAGCTHGLFAQSSSASEFKPSGKVWGYAFGDMYLKNGGDTATWSSRAEYSGVLKDVYAFGIRRMYLGYDYTISPKFSTSALLEGGDAYLTQRGDRTVTIKALNVKWKGIYKGADLVVGHQSSLTFSYIAEKVWNYRSIEKTIVDQRGIRSSSDAGIALLGTFDSLANFGYNIMVGNGTGTRPEELTKAGKHKIYYGELYGYFFDRKLVVDLYGDYQTGLNDKNVYILKSCLAWQTEPFTLGVELFTQKLLNSKSDGTDAAPGGFSIFARGRVIKDKLHAFARYDSYNPDNSYRDSDAITTYNAANMNKHYDETFFVAGVDFTPHKNVHFMPNLWLNSYSPKAESALLVERKADIVPRLTCYFIFR